MPQKFIRSSGIIALIVFGLNASAALAQSAPPSPSPQGSYSGQYSASGTMPYPPMSNGMSSSSYPMPPYMGSSTMPYPMPNPGSYGTSSYPTPSYPYPPVPSYMSSSTGAYTTATNTYQNPPMPYSSSTQPYPLPAQFMNMIGSSTMPNFTPDMMKMMNSMYQNFQQSQGQGQQGQNGQGQNQWQQVQQQLQSQGFGFGDDQGSMMDQQHEQMMQQMLQHFKMITKQLLRMENQLKNRLAILQKRGFVAPQDCTNTISAIDSMRIAVQNASTTSDMSGFGEQSDFMDGVQTCRSEVEELLSVSNMIKKAPIFLRWLQNAGVDISGLQDEYNGLAAQLAAFKTTPATSDQIDSFFDALDSFKSDVESAMDDVNVALPSSLQQLDQIEQQYRKMNNGQSGPQSNAQTQNQKSVLGSLQAQLGAAAAALQGMIHR